MLDYFCVSFAPNEWLLSSYAATNLESEIGKHAKRKQIKTTFCLAKYFCCRFKTSFLFLAATEVGSQVQSIYRGGYNFSKATKLLINSSSSI
jgi:hypothetical protein